MIKTINSNEPHNPFINKYQPIFLNDFQQLDDTIIKLMKSLIYLNNLNVLIVGDSGTGKLQLLNPLLKNTMKMEMIIIMTMF